MTTNEIERALPSPPDGYHYSIEQKTSLVYKVWLHHPDYLFRKDVRTIYCFIKRSKVHAPRTSDKMRVEPLCPLDQLANQPPYTTIIPTTTSLLHLL